MTQQPDWEFLCNFGDVHPLDYGGLFLYIDKTGVYAPELERLEPLETDDAGESTLLEVRRVVLERQKEVRHEDSIYLVPCAYESNWPHPIGHYVEWFTRGLQDVTTNMGCELEELLEELREALCSEDPKRLAWAYINIVGYYGWHEFDCYPLALTRGEAKARYQQNELNH